MLDKEWLTAIGTLTAGMGALIASVARLIEVLKPKEKQPTKRPPRRFK
ncbi:TPA: hypothetical protein ACGO1T_001836 [Streptococcus suis]